MTDQCLIDKFVREKGELWVSFGAYEHISKSQASDGDALADCQPWLEPLIKVAPTLEFSSGGIFKKELLVKLSKQSSLNPTSLRGDLWVAERANRVLTVCYHMRKIKRSEYELQKVAATTEGSKFEALTRMLAMMDPGSELPGGKNATGDAPSEMANTATEPAASERTVSEAAVSEAAGEKPCMSTSSETEVQQCQKPKTNLFSQLYPEKAADSPPAKKIKVKKVTPEKHSAGKEKVIQYRKEYYKATNTFGFKRHCTGEKAKQILSLGSKQLSKEVLEVLANKVLGSLNSLEVVNEETEAQVVLLAKFKLQKLLA